MSGNDPIGNGLLLPFRRDAKGDFANGSGLDVLRSDIHELLGLRAGELAWDMDRGTKLHTLLHRRLHSEMTRALADQYASGVLREFEPRVRVGQVSVVTEGDDTLQVSVTYRPLGFLRAPEETVVRKP